jgi:hypothetical protein
MSKARIETITPKMAEKMLERNNNNRPLRENYVIELAQAMVEGEWQLNGETIKVDKNGDIKDGQHRLNAIVLAGKAIKTYVIRGLEPDVFDTIDRGRNRTIGDVLYRHGKIHHNVLAGALSWLFKFENKVVDRSRRADASASPSNRPRATQAVDLLERHPKLEESIIKVNNSTGRLVSPSLMSCLHYLFSKKDAKMADAFMEALASGENLRKTQAVYKLREFLIRNKTAKRKANLTEVAALTVKAWNFSRNGDTVQVLRWGGSIDKPEAFPQIK